MSRLLNKQCGLFISYRCCCYQGLSTQISHGCFNIIMIYSFSMFRKVNALNFIQFGKKTSFCIPNFLVNAVEFGVYMHKKACSEHFLSFDSYVFMAKIATYVDANLNAAPMTLTSYHAKPPQHSNYENTIGHAKNQQGSWDTEC